MEADNALEFRLWPVFARFREDRLKPGLQPRAGPGGESVDKRLCCSAGARRNIDDANGIKGVARTRAASDEFTGAEASAPAQATGKDQESSAERATPTGVGFGACSGIGTGLGGAISRRAWVARQRTRWSGSAAAARNAAQAA